MRRPQHTIFVFHRRQRNRSRDIRHGAPCGRYDLRRGLVQDAVIVSLQPDANFFVSYHVFSLTPPGDPGGKNWRQAARRFVAPRSEERRVGKECKTRWWPDE